jgi:hypothetical protein
LEIVWGSIVCFEWAKILDRISWGRFRLLVVFSLIPRRLLLSSAGTLVTVST